jgi:hypothetical protein
MTPVLVSSHVNLIAGGRKEIVKEPTDSTMEFRIKHEFRGAKAANVDLVLFHTTYDIGAPSIAASTDFELKVVHISRFEIEAPLTDTIASDSVFCNQMITIASPLAHAKVSSLLSDFGLNARVPISRPTETDDQPTKRITKRASKTKHVKP